MQQEILEKMKLQQQSLTTNMLKALLTVLQQKDYLDAEDVQWLIDKAVSESAEQTNCQVSWNANTSDAGIVLGQPGDICVNPISWTTGEQIVEPNENKGSISFANGNTLDQSIVGAQCKNGTLLVEETKSERYSIMPFGPGNYHYYDYSFYHMDVRDNAILRAKSFLKDHSENTLMDTLLLETGN